VPTHYSDGGIAPRTNAYAYGTGGRKRMPYDTKAQARAVMANTDGKNPKHREARMHAKAAMKRKPMRKNGLMVKQTS